ncbi:benzoate/H(+) symporter BenE family transporter [Zhaonella formicivorans]|uniref:benzoate/H(+) symporter BenE family transporter n=1 Tax=Zhaonella formicivorans TaxID=2528593 RepID=UPI001D1068FE|nr:benzoate/H(+) symporter BenE family transporter [Zhaonella formicivorans]
MGGYLLVARFMKNIPGALGALVFGVIAFIVTGSPDFSGVHFTLTGPMFVKPQFNLMAAISVGIPLAILVIGAENAQSIGVLKALGYDPPVNAMTIYSGIFGTLGPFLGIHNVNIAGPMTVMTCSPEVGKKELRYGASFLNDFFYGIAGPFVIPLVAFLAVIPKPLVTIVAGLAMLRVVSSSLIDTFAEGKFLMGGFFAFIIGASNITVLQISAAFWALLGGCLVSLLLEGKDYAEFRKQQTASL